jgi:thiopurine S-methyltransferase
MDRLEYWKTQWQANKAFWHKMAVNKFLMEHYDKIKDKPHPAQVFVPLCGKSLDMRW